MKGMNKCRLQELCQRQRWKLPVYEFSKEGPDHAPRFQATVIVQDCSFSKHSFFNSLKEAQNAAAEVAISQLQLPHPIISYKNLLQELVQKYHYPLPIYNTKKYGELHSPVFFSIVEVKGQMFRGLEARTKKQAEMSAAKIAYTSLRQCEESSQSPKMLPSTGKQEATL